jgi:hypothetical protein
MFVMSNQRSLVRNHNDQSEASKQDIRNQEQQDRHARAAAFMRQEIEQEKKCNERMRKAGLKIYI